MARRQPDSVNVGQADLDPLFAWKIDASDTCHVYPLSLTLLVLRVRADHSHDPSPPDDSTIVTTPLN